MAPRDLPAQSNGIVNPVGQEQVLKIASNLRKDMPALEATDYLSKSGLRPCMAQNDHGTLSWFYSFTNAGTHTVRWKSPAGETKSADLPNTKTLVLQFEPKKSAASQEWRSLDVKDCVLQGARVHDTVIKLKKAL